MDRCLRELCVPDDPRNTPRDCRPVEMATRQGKHVRQQDLFKTMASVLIAWPLEEEIRSEEICGKQPESGRLEEDAEAAEPETPQQPPEPLLPQQSLAAQPSPLLPLEKFDDD